MAEKENKKPIEPTEVAPVITPVPRRIVLPVGEVTSEQYQHAIDTYKKARVQLEKHMEENDIKAQEIQEIQIEANEAEAKVAALPPFDKKTTTEAVKVNIPPPVVKKKKTQEEIDLDKKIEVEQKAVMEALKVKHDAEIREVLNKTDFTTLDEETKKAIHSDALAKVLDIEKIPTEIQQEALKAIQWADGKPIDLTKLLTDEQKQIIQTYQTKKYLEALAAKPKVDIGELEKRYPGINKFTDEVSKLTPIKPGDPFLGSADILLSQESFFQEINNNATFKKEIVDKIVARGMLMSEINSESKLGKEIAGIIEANVDEYISIKKWEDASPIPEYLKSFTVEDLKGLQDVLWASYSDLIFHENLLGSDHEINKIREEMFQVYKDGLASMVEPDPNDPKAVEEYQKAAAEQFTQATGLPANTVQQVARTLSTRDNLSPLVRALADIFAPLGALMGGDIGEFWRNYLNESGMRRDIEAWDNAYGKSQSAPVEWKWIENAEPGSIHAAARGYLWTTEADNPDKVKEFHKSGGSAVRGAWTGTAWCMSFVQHVLRKDMWFTSEQIGQPTARAADGHKIGRHVDTKDAQPWDIIMVKSKAANSGRHIGFVDKVYPDGSVDVLGGNQGSSANSVRIDRYSPGQIAEIRTLQMPKTSESTPTSPDVAKSSSDIVNYAIELTKKSRQEAIMWAEHCTDWIDRIYKAKTGRSVYEAPKTYNAVVKIPWWDYGGTAAPREVVDNIRPWQHLMLDKPKNGHYNAGSSHSVIAIEKPVDGMAKVVSYPNGGKQPVVETYDLLWLWRTADKQGRVIRIQW
jgi:CHAP domain